LSRVTEGLGESWEIMATSYKPYPCGFVIHPVLDCVLDWRREHPTAAVKSVLVRGNPLLVLRTDRPNISTGRESQVSVQHGVAAALVFGNAGLQQFTDTCARDERVARLRAKVSVEGDESISTVAAAVTVLTEDGQKFELSQAAARGSDGNPLSDQELENKLRTAAREWDPQHGIEPLIANIWELDKNQDVSKLAAMSVP
jgi:2-methylcitrate dehydratase PrpD